MTDTQQMSLGQRLRYERENRHWTQEQLAEEIGGSVPSINRWENDRAVPRKDMLERLREVFGKPLEQWGMGKKVLWHVPFLRNVYFTGREATLQRLHKLLAPGYTGALSQISAISGLGGIGKTQTALEYAYRYAEEYEAVLWVRADSQENVTTDFALLATTLDLREKAEHNQFLVITAVKRWLQEHGPWLLIFDNVDDLAVLSDFLPRRAHGAILLTTRSQITGSHIKKIPLDKLSQEEGVTFLLRHVAARDDLDDEEIPPTRISYKEQQAAQELWAMMDGLPLALDQAGKYVETRQSSLAEYVDLYRTHRTSLLRERGTAIPAYPASVATTWSLAFERVEQNNPAAAELLRLCAFLAPDAIPEELITNGSAHSTVLLQTMVTSALALNDAIGTLRAYSLVRREPEARLLSVHRLVQAVLQDSLDEAAKRAWAERAMLTVNAVFPHIEWGIWPQCEQLLPHALLVAHFIEQYSITSEAAGRLLHEMAGYLLSRARSSEVEQFCQRALHIREQILGPEHPDVALSLAGLANLYANQGKFAEAEPLYQRALHIREQRLGLEHLDVAAICNELANLYRLQGTFAEGELFFKRALHIREQCLEPEHPLVAFTLTGLGTFYAEQGKYSDAEPLLQHAVQIRERYPGPDVAHSLNNLACLYSEQGRYAEAGQLFQRTLRIREQYLGPEHPDLAHPLTGLADTYCQQKKYAEAKPLYQRALRLWEYHLGSKHPYVAYPLTSLANLYREKGKYAKAEPLFRRALHIREQALGTYHPDTAETLHSLARLLDAQDVGEEARDWYTRALAARERIFGVEHKKTRETLSYFTAWLQRRGYMEEAAQLLTVQRVTWRVFPNERVS